MRRWAGVLFAVAGTTALLAVAGVASSEDGKAAFERREDTMKHMGRPFYVGIGRVVKGTTAYGPDTVTAMALGFGVIENARMTPAAAEISALAEEIRGAASG
jgi:hypothetical protein